MVIDSIFKPYKGNISDIVTKENKYTYLVGAGISREAPSNLDSAKVIGKELLKLCVPEAELENLLSLESLRYEMIVELVKRSIDQNLSFLNYFEDAITPNIIHLFLAESIIEKEYVITTNFDYLIEYALLNLLPDSKKDLIYPVITQKDYEFFRNPTEIIDKYPIFKIHGSKKNIITNSDTTSTIITSLSDLGKSRHKSTTFSIESYKKPTFIKCTQDRVLVVMGYSGSDDFDIAPMLRELKHMKLLVWIEHTDSDTIEIYKADKTKILSIPDNLTHADKILSELWSFTDTDIVRIKINTKILVKDYLLSLLYPDLKDKIQNMIKTSSENKDFGEWITNKFETIPELVKYKLAGEIYFELAQFDDVIRCGEKGVELSNKQNAISLKSDFLNQLGNVYYRRTEFQKATVYYEEALKLAKEINNPFLTSSRLNNLGLVYFEQGELDKASDLLEEALEIGVRLGNKKGTAYRLNNLGLIHMFQGNYDKAMEKYNESLKINNQIGNLIGKKNCINNMGDLFDRQGKYSEALMKYQEALRIAEEIGDINGKAILLKGIGEVYAKIGDISKSILRLEQAIEVFNDLGMDILKKQTEQILKDVKSSLK